MKDDLDLDKWLKNAVESSAEPMEKSAMFISIATKSYLKSPLCALQLGMAILMDKPIVLIVDKNEKMPEALVKIAKIIERVDFDNKADMSRAMKSISKFTKTLPEM